MSRPVRAERQAKGRPKRRAAAKSHYFKYQLAKDPSLLEKNDLKRALQESLEEQKVTPNGNSLVNKKNNNQKKTVVNSSTNSSDVSKTSNNSSSTSNESCGSTSTMTTTTTPVANLKRTRSAGATIAIIPLPSKRAKLTGDLKQNHNDNHKTKCDNDPSVLCGSPPVASSQNNGKAIRTYSRGQPESNGRQHQNNTNDNGPRSSTPISAGMATLDKAAKSNGVTNSTKAQLNYVSRSTQTKPPKINQINVQQQSNKQNDDANSKSNETNKNTSNVTPKSTNSSTIEPPPQPPVQEPYKYLNFKRESKNYAYVKMTALKVSTSKSPSGQSRSTNSKKSSPNGILNNNGSNKDSNSKTSPKSNNCNRNNVNDLVTGRSSPNVRRITSSESLSNSVNLNPNADPKQQLGKKSPAAGNSSAVIVRRDDKSSDSIRQKQTSTVLSKTGNTKRDPPNATTNVATQINRSDRSLNHNINNNLDLSELKNQNQANLNVTKTRLPPGSWSLLGIPEEKVIYLRDDEPPRRLICYPAIKHVEGDVIQVRDSVLLRSGAKKTDLPYIAKVCAFWEDAETGGVMMSLFWYYRPEHTEDGRKPHHLPDEIFASRHRDVDSVECIEDKCYVLTFNEYCRYKKRCKMEEVNTTWSLADVTIPVSNESYPRRNRIPEMDVNPELVFCCRQIYDSRLRRLIKNPLINPKYGHI